MPIKLEPSNPLEVDILRARDGQLSLDQLLVGLGATELFVSCQTDPGPDGSAFRPLCFQVDGQKLLAMFTSPKRAELHTQVAPYIINMTGAEIVSRLPKGYGLFLNPGFEGEFIIPQSGVVRLAAQFAETS